METDDGDDGLAMITGWASYSIERMHGEDKRNMRTRKLEHTAIHFVWHAVRRLLLVVVVVFEFN